MDSYYRRGMVASAQLPLTLGVDGAGVVVAAGDRSTAKAGDRVAWERVWGSYAEMLAVPNERLIPIPEGVAFEATAGGLMQGLTAQHLCYDSVPVPNGSVVVVHSAASGVGRMLTQLVTARAGA
jgi:NADPH2:quinone reductase